MVVFPTPELVPATTMVGILVAGVVVRALKTVDPTSDAICVAIRCKTDAVRARAQLVDFYKVNIW